MKPRPYGILILCGFIYALCSGVIGCKTETPQQPKPILTPTPASPASEWEWHLKENTLLSKDQQYVELMRMLEYVDKQIDKIDRINAWQTSRHEIRTGYLEVRLQLLYHIYNLSDFLLIESLTEQ